MNGRTVCFVSDRTGLTAETLGFSLLAQFGRRPARTVTMPFVASVRDAEGVVARINDIAIRDGERPIVLSTLVDDQVRAVVRSANAFFLDFFDAFLAPLELELGMQSAHVAGFEASDSSRDPAHSGRIDAVNFALANDDGAGQRDYRSADVILVGVSRSGKTPTSLYMALQYGVRAANVPLTEEDFEQRELPRELQPHRRKLFGLTISPERLQQIRSERRPGSRYASATQVDFEVRSARAMMERNQIPFVDVTECSVEEIASRILDRLKLERHIRA
ncbi:MAG TPA: pyruvate, water dikinase regulatory protein [Steroidobacteraceae bacterium]|nr:pyruvate, water dikinase regulatory protein [Steroidobacteraceae bacterium]